MKSGNVKILTFVESVNYGALLQAFALRSFIGKLGYQCELIHYNNPKRKFSQVRGLRFIRSLIYYYTVAWLFRNRERLRKTNEFKKLQLGLNPAKMTSPAQLASLNDTTDAYIVGSDQVWNPLNNADDDSYLLNFASADKKRIAYACSFGTRNIADEYLKRHSVDFGRFNHISVRETSAQAQLKKTLELDSSVVVDPVFLFSKEEWMDFFPLKTPMMEGDYILCYLLPGYPGVADKIYSVANELSRKNHCRMIILGSKGYSARRGGEILLKSAGPVDFLNLLFHAKCVVTNSFHGTCFSVIFHRMFYTVLPDSDAKSCDRNTRMTELLELLGLSKHLLHLSDENDGLPAFPEIGELFRRKIQESKDFIIHALEE